MEQSRIDRIKKSIYYITKPMQDKYSFGISSIYSKNKNKNNSIYNPTRFESAYLGENTLTLTNDVLKYGYSKIQDIQGSENAIEKRFIMAMHAAMSTITNVSKFSQNNKTIIFEPTPESECYYYCFVGTFNIENHCEINRKIFEVLNIISISIELQELHEVVTQQISLNIKNNERSWLSTSTFDVKNDPVFLLSLQQLLKSNYNLSIEDIKNNIFEAISLIELFEY